MKKLSAFGLACVLILSMAACGEAPETTVTSVPVTEPQASSATAEETEGGKIEVEKELFDVVITLPADMVGETTQEQLDAEADPEHFHSAVLNDDGSVTFEMSKRQHKELLKELAEDMDESFNEMIGSEDYPNVTDIQHNHDYTHFTVTTTSEKLSMDESFSVLVFYFSGGMYNVFAGDEDAAITVDFVNADSGEIISSANSSEMDE